MRFFSPTPAIAIVVALLAATGSAARADGRAELVSCQALIERAAQAGAAARPDDAALQRCRQIVRDWTLRESRMTVDEQGRPLR
jgi:hypothetical protein